MWLIFYMRLADNFLELRYEVLIDFRCWLASQNGAGDKCFWHGYFPSDDYITNLESEKIE